MVLDQTGAVDIEFAGGAVGRNVEQCGALTPMLPPEQRILQEEEVRMPPRKEAHGHESYQPPDHQLPPGGTRVVPQIFTDVRIRDVGPDRRSDVWSPGNMLEDTVAQMQRHLADIQAENRLLRTPGLHLWCLPPSGGFYDKHDKYFGLVGAGF